MTMFKMNIYRNTIQQPSRYKYNFRRANLESLNEELNDITFNRYLRTFNALDCLVLLRDKILESSSKRILGKS